MDLSASIEINRPMADVFDYVMDVTHDAEWRSGIVEAGFTTDPPLAVGTKGYDRVEANGRDMEVTWTVVDFSPGEFARWTLDSGPIQGTGGYICRPSADGTSFTLEAEVRPGGLYRLLGPIFGLIGRRRNQADVEKLKSIVESRI